MYFNRTYPLSMLIIFCCLLLTTAGAAVGQGEPEPGQSKVEICDGIDNDGDGDIDEGFDVDRDGVARCCSCDPFFATVSDNRIETHIRNCADPAFTQGAQPAFEDFSGATNVQLHAVADFDGNCGLDILWRDTNTFQRKLTSCRQGEWQTTDLEFSDLAFFGGADLDSNGTADLAGMDATCCFTTANAGTTALNGGGGLPMFNPEIYGAYDISPINGAWLFGRPYNLQDMDGDGAADVMFWDYATGGASTTNLHFASGLNDGTFGPTATLPNTVNNQPQNFGDLGDIDGDGCADWVGGPDDDGNKGGVFFLRGDCAGNFAPATATLLVDACVGCPGSGSGHGSGISQLYDWDCDGDNDLITSHTVTTGSTATFQYWDNPSWTSTTILNAVPVSTRFASPLRNYDRDVCR